MVELVSSVIFHCYDISPAHISLSGNYSSTVLNLLRLEGLQNVLYGSFHRLQNTPEVSCHGVASRCFPTLKGKYCRRISTFRQTLRGKKRTTTTSTSRGSNSRNKKKFLPLRFELRMLDSKSRVITTSL